MVVHSFFFFNCCATLQYINKPESSHPRSCSWPRGLFLVWAVLNNASMRISLHALWWGGGRHKPSFLLGIPGRRTSGHRVNVPSALVETAKPFSIFTHPPTVPETLMALYSHQLLVGLAFLLIFSHFHGCGARGDSGRHLAGRKEEMLACSSAEKEIQEGSEREKEGQRQEDAETCRWKPRQRDRWMEGGK